MPNQLHLSVKQTPSPDQESWGMGTKELVKFSMRSSVKPTVEKVRQQLVRDSAYSLSWAAKCTSMERLNIPS